MNADTRSANRPLPVPAVARFGICIDEGYGQIVRRLGEFMGGF